MSFRTVLFDIEIIVYVSENSNTSIKKKIRIFNILPDLNISFLHSHRLASYCVM